MKIPDNAFESVYCKNRSELRDWLSNNYNSSPGIWLIYDKIKDGVRNVSYDDIVEEVLCFGWIDSLPRTFTETQSKLLLTPRKPKSVWSKLNKSRIEKLIDEGLMHEAGMAKILQAQKDGSWDTLNDSDNLVIHDDLKAEFNANPRAYLFYSSLSDSVKRNTLQYIYDAKTSVTRKNRINQLIQACLEGKRLR